MKNIVVLYKEYKSKCLTFSYDDGVKQDLKFLNYIKNTKFKVTFNLNSRLFAQLKYRDGVDNSRLDNVNLKEIYKGHEIASHSLYHFHLENRTYQENDYQIKEDLLNLKNIFSYQIRGFAYPYGTYSNDTLDALKANDICYARTTKSTYRFDIPNDFLLWHPSIHHNDKRIEEIVEEFLKTNQELALLYIWGHTYEFDNQNNWNILEYLIDKLDNHDDIAYLTNIEVYDYIMALRNVEIIDSKIVNKSNLSLYLKVDEEYITIKPYSNYDVKGEFIWKKY